MVDIDPAEWDARRKAGQKFEQLTDVDKAYRLAQREASHYSDN